MDPTQFLARNYLMSDLLLRNEEFKKIFDCQVEKFTSGVVQAVGSFYLGNRTNESMVEAARTIANHAFEVVDFLKDKCSDDEFATALWEVIESSEIVKHMKSSKFAAHYMEPTEEIDDRETPGNIKARKFLDASHKMLRHVLTDDNALRGYFFRLMLKTKD